MAEYIVSKSVGFYEVFSLSPKERKEVWEITKRDIKKELNYSILKHIEITQSRGDFGEPVFEARVFVFDKRGLKEFVDKIKQQATNELIDLLRGDVK